MSVPKFDAEDRCWTSFSKKEESEEEEDYMSDAFLASCASVSSDVRPGLPMSYSQKRARDVEKKKEAKDLRKKQKKVSQEERRQEGLNTAIDSSNKGFAMLQKMGYKPGTSLGKGSGRLEPVKVEIKADRKGLGLKEKLLEMRKEKEKKYLAKMKKQNDEFDPVKFREQKRLQLAAKRLESDLHKCQRTCYRLDSEKNIEEPVEWYFWPDHLLPKTEETEDQEEEESEENYNKQDELWQMEIHLEVLTTYLRNAYLYCVWCGTAFNDEHDIQNNCPGPMQQDHDEEL